MQLAQQRIAEHFERAVSNVHHIQRPPLAEDAKKLILRILADPRTQIISGYREALEKMCTAS